MDSFLVHQAGLQRSGSSIQHPASNIQYPKSSRQKPASAWNPRSERTNNGVCVRKYIYLGALPGITKGSGGVNTGVDVGIRMPFALRLRQLTQIVSSSTPTGRMRDVAMED